MKKYYTTVARKIAGSEIVDKKLKGRTMLPVAIGMDQRIEATVSEMYDHNHLDQNNNPTVINFPQVFGDTIRVNFTYEGAGNDTDSLQTSYEYKGRLFTSAQDAVDFINEQFGFLAEFQISEDKLYVVNHMFPGKLTDVYVTIFWD